MERIRMAIVGAGTWGENHARLYDAHPQAETVAVCDADIARARAMAARHRGIPAYADVQEMLRSTPCDAVAIVTPDFAHADAAVACAEAGKHLLVEKPLATTRRDVLRIVEAAGSKGVRVMVDFHNRWSPPFNVAHEAVTRGELGDPYSAYFRLNDVKWVATDMLSWTAQSSILWFLGSHSLDTLRWFFSDDVERVHSVSRSGVLAASGIPTVDIYQTTLEFRRGGIAQMENAWITPNGNPCLNDIKFTILGTRGMISIDASNHTLIQKYTEERVETPDILVKHSVDGFPRGFAFESIRAFVDRLVDGRDFLVSLEDAARTSLALLAVMESAERREPVRVQY